MYLSLNTPNKRYHTVPTVAHLSTNIMCLRGEALYQQQETTARDTRFRLQVQAGLDSANEGDLISDDEVEAEAVVWRESKV